MLLWAVIDMNGLDGVVLGGTGGGVFLYVVMHDETAKKGRKNKLKYRSNLKKSKPQFRYFKMRFCEKVMNNKYTCCRSLLKQPEFEETELNSDHSNELAASLPSGLLPS